MAMMCRQIIGAGSSAAGWVGLIVATATNDWVRTCDFSVSTCVRLDELGSRGLWVECVNNPAMMHCVPLNPVLNLPGESSSDPSPEPRVSPPTRARARESACACVCVLTKHCPCEDSLSLRVRTPKYLGLGLVPSPGSGAWGEGDGLERSPLRQTLVCVPAYMQTARALMVIACLLGLAAMLLVLLSLTCIRLQNDTAVIKHRRALAGGVLFLVMALCGIISTVWFPVGAHQSGGLMSFGFSLYAGWVGSALCLLGGLTLLLCRVIMAGPPDRDNSFYYSRQGGTAVPLDGPGHGKSARV
ncbi:claudin-11-like isoform X1 [Synchiropus splendidus]|uniref:claudin-11-like isoform X1 n=1 Tax=Synchiropus splendidus TaxID=270530 RepID=UPI00237EAC62|nr:claudin-11-like isoform X1 [Synchiropus splendidus]